MLRTHVASRTAVLLALAWLPAVSQQPALAVAKSPNIVVIVADDLGWADVSFHGKEIKTPHIDRLVAEGAELSRFYVCPVCSPTRAGLMTGRYPIRFGLMRAVVPPWRKGGLDTSEVTLADVLAKGGYRHRGVFGKWHLGHSDVKYHPLRRGFTEFLGHYNGAIDYFTHQREGELDWHRGYESNHDKGYSTDLIAAAAAKFIERHAGDDAPFFCYVPFNAPHSPLQAKDEDLQKYRDLAADQPQRRRIRRQKLAAMISSLDEGVGRILDTLESKKIAGDTLVWFFSDNGGIPPGDNRPLNGRKGTVFEGGIRVAAAARWPGKIPAGKKIDVPLAYVDVLPTLMRVAKVESHGGKPLDGVDALDVLTGKQTELKRDLYSYIGQQGEANEQITVIEPEWKLIVIGPRITNDDVPRSKRTTHLHRIASDPYEKNDLAADHPEIVERMWNKLLKFRALQPADAVPPYGQGREGFTAPKEWRIPGTPTP